MKSRDYPLVTYLENLRDRDDRAAMAKLRRGLGKRMGTPDMYPYVVRFLPEAQWMQEIYFLIAALFSLHPEPAPWTRSLGAVFRAVQGLEPTDSIEKRFVRLLEADSEDVGFHLKQAISLAKAKGIAISFHRLMFDLLNWNHEGQFVQLTWAKDYWTLNKKTQDATIEKGDQQP
jgi:CRISPR system Cascade subunit CasB